MLHLKLSPEPCLVATIDYFVCKTILCKYVGRYMCNFNAITGGVPPKGL